MNKIISQKKGILNKVLIAIPIRIQEEPKEVDEE